MNTVTPTTAVPMVSSPPVPGVRGATYYVVGPRRAQDGATVWAVVRSLEAGGRMLAIAEYMNEHAAIRAMNDLNAAAARATALTLK